MISRYLRLFVLSTLFILIANIHTQADQKTFDIPIIKSKDCAIEECFDSVFIAGSDLQLYTKPQTDSPIKKVLKKNSKAFILKSKSILFPGKALITGTPYKNAKSLDPQKEILILEYVGEGRSKVYQSGKTMITKIARKKDRCIKNPNWRYCRVKVIEEPIHEWWLFISTENKDTGWVLMSGFHIWPNKLG